MRCAVIRVTRYALNEQVTVAQWWRLPLDIMPAARACSARCGCACQKLARICCCVVMVGGCGLVAASRSSAFHSARCARPRDSRAGVMAWS